jgi:hypothetical protein
LFLKHRRCDEKVAADLAFPGFIPRIKLFRDPEKRSAPNLFLLLLPHSIVTLE